MNGEPQQQSKSAQAMQNAAAGMNLAHAVRNWNDAPASPIVGAKGGNPVGGQVIDAASTDITGAGAGAAAGAGEAAGAGSVLADLAPLAALA